MSDTRARTIVYTLTIDHKHGTDTRVFHTEEGAKDALAAWARKWWPTECEWMEPRRYTQAEFDALPDGEAVTEYFKAMETARYAESYNLDQATVED